MGVFAPGFKTLANSFFDLSSSIEKDALKYGLLGSSAWVSHTERSSSNEILTIMYFKNTEGLHAFAHDEAHRDIWNWWNRNVHAYPHLSIWHEMYRVPKGSWENIYINAPRTLLGAANYPLKAPNGEVEWLPPVVDARRGVLRSSKGRMTSVDEPHNERDEFDPYDQD